MCYNISVTIARAIELKHSPSIVSSLAYETAKLFEEAGTQLLDVQIHYHTYRVCASVLIWYLERIYKVCMWAVKDEIHFLCNCQV